MSVVVKGKNFKCWRKVSQIGLIIFTRIIPKLYSKLQFFERVEGLKADTVPS